MRLLWTESGRRCLTFGGGNPLLGSWLIRWLIFFCKPLPFDFFRFEREFCAQHSRQIAQTTTIILIQTNFFIFPTLMIHFLIITPNCFSISLQLLALSFIFLPRHFTYRSDPIGIFFFFLLEASIEHLAITWAAWLLCKKKITHKFYFYLKQEDQKKVRGRKPGARLFPSNDNRRLREAKKSRCERWERAGREEMHNKRNERTRRSRAYAAQCMITSRFRDVNKSLRFFSSLSALSDRNCWTVQRWRRSMGRRKLYAAS